MRRVSHKHLATPTGVVGQPQLIRCIGSSATGYGSQEIEYVLSVLAITVTVCHNTFVFFVDYLGSLFSCAATLIALFISFRFLSLQTLLDMVQDRSRGRIRWLRYSG